MVHRRKGTVGGGKVVNFWMSLQAATGLKDMVREHGVTGSSIVEALILEAYTKRLRFEMKEVVQYDAAGKASMRSRVVIMGPKK